MDLEAQPRLWLCLVGMPRTQERSTQSRKNLSILSTGAGAGTGRGHVQVCPWRGGGDRDTLGLAEEAAQPKTKSRGTHGGQRAQIGARAFKMGLMTPWQGTVGTVGTVRGQ